MRGAEPLPAVGGRFVFFSRGGAPGRGAPPRATVAPPRRAWLPDGPERDQRVAASTALTQALLACATPDALLSLASSHLPNLDKYNLTSLLTTAARLAESPGVAASLTSDARFPPLLRAAGGVVLYLSPRARANVLWACAKLRVRPPWLDGLVASLRPLLEQCKPQELSNAMFALATLGMRPGAAWMDSFWEVTLHSLSRAADVAAADDDNSSVAGPPPPPPPPQWPQEQPAAHAVSRAAAPRASAGGVGTFFVPQALSNVLWAAATLQDPPPPRWAAAWFASMTAVFPELYPQAMSNSTWAVAKLAPLHAWLAPPVGFLDEMEKASLSILKLFKPQEAAALLYAFAELRHAPSPAWLQKFVDSGKAVTSEPQGLCVTLYAFGVLATHPGRKFMDDWARAALGGGLLGDTNGPSAGSKSDGGAISPRSLRVANQTLGLSLWALCGARAGPARVHPKPRFSLFSPKSPNFYFFSPHSKAVPPCPVLQEYGCPAFRPMWTALLDGVGAECSAELENCSAPPSSSLPPPDPLFPPPLLIDDATLSPASKSGGGGSSRSLMLELLYCVWKAVSAEAPGAAAAPAPPPALLAAARAAWVASGEVSAGDRMARTHAEVLSVLQEMGITAQCEAFCPDTERRVDVALFRDMPPSETGSNYDLLPPGGSAGGEERGGIRVAIEIDGDTHFCDNSGAPTGRTVLRNRLLARAGWRLIHVLRDDWPPHKPTQVAFLSRRLAEVGYLDLIEGVGDTNAIEERGGAREEAEAAPPPPLRRASVPRIDAAAAAPGLARRRRAAG